ncbi:uncharacterized protein [Arachis hypogaea]|uniref:uncharacterized protein n=1 Tax=Arachis hypogaea TaxID=3818 RepID=UPI003B21031D
MDPITDFLESGKLPGDKNSTKALRREVAKYTIIQGQLFKKGPNQPLLKCLHPDQMDYVLREVHEGCCGYHIGAKAQARMHIGAKALARKLIRAGYYWSSMMKDSKEFVRKCVNRLPRTLPGRSGASQVPYSYYRLLYQVDRGRATSQHILIQLSEVYVETAKVLICGTPLTNGQVKAANKVILLGLKKLLDKKKGAWADELASVLWSYCTTQQSSTEETPFCLTYGVDAMIPVKVGEPSPRLLLGGVEEAVEKDLVDEAREMVHLSEAALK